jgi:DNA-directed RNA polymerase subunit E'/Rpb7
MEHTAIFEEQVSLTPTDFKRVIKSIDSILLEKLRARIENKCSRHGYVIPNTLKILSRSMGMVERGRFTGNIIFRVQAEGGVINPSDGVILKGDVIRKNKMGLYVNYRDAIRVIVPRDMSIGDREFEDVQIGDIVNVEIKKSRFQVNDEYILSVGSFQNVDTKATEAKNTAALEAIPEGSKEEVVEDTEQDENAEEAEAIDEAEAAEEATDEAEAAQEATDEEDMLDENGSTTTNLPAQNVSAQPASAQNVPASAQNVPASAQNVPASASAQETSANQNSVKNALAGNAIRSQSRNLSPAGKEDN